MRLGCNYLVDLVDFLWRVITLCRKIVCRQVRGTAFLWSPPTTKNASRVEKVYEEIRRELEHPKAQSTPALLEEIIPDARY